MDDTDELDEMVGEAGTNWIAEGAGEDRDREWESALVDWEACELNVARRMARCRFRALDLLERKTRRRACDVVPACLATSHSWISVGPVPSATEGGCSESSSR